MSESDPDDVTITVSGDDRRFVAEALRELAAKVEFKTTLNTASPRVQRILADRRARISALADQVRPQPLRPL
jgi:hypothetical protein